MSQKRCYGSYGYIQFNIHYLELWFHWKPPSQSEMNIFQGSDILLLDILANINIYLSLAVVI